MSANLKLLKKVRCRLLDQDSGQPLPGIVVTLSLGTGDGDGPHIPVSSLSSDATGYLSFDLQPLIDSGLSTADSLLVSAPQLGIKDRDLLEIVTSSNGAGGGDGRGMSFTHVESSASGTPNGHGLAIEFPIYVDTAHAPHPKPASTCESTLPAVQAPDNIDYELSPYSFVAPPPVSFTSDCCENIAPATLPVQEHGFYRVVVRHERGDNGAIEGRIERDVTITDPLTTPKPVVTLADVLEYRQRWYAIGHSLGDIKYSLPLAPGESTELALIEWSRQDTASRKDDITSTEFLQHEQHRDRSIEDSIDAGLKESQGGWSWMGGMSSGMAYDAKAYGQYTGNWAMGGGTSNSWGQRDLKADSLQDLHDSVGQGTSLVRTLTSTVIVQATQEEQNTVQTRRVANHNHCHALTMQYYEVLRHFRVHTEYVGTRKAVLIPFAPIMFDEERALRFRTQLEAAILDESLLPCFDALVRQSLGPTAYEDDGSSGHHPPPPPPPPPQTSKYFTGTKSGVTVDSAMSTNDMNLLIQKGSTLTISATGQGIKYGFGWIDGLGPQGGPNKAQTPFPGVDMHEYALLAQIGGDLYEVGVGTTITAKNDGDLKFFFNDWKFDDNKGTASVDFIVTAPTPPPPPVPDPTGGSAGKTDSGSTTTGTPAYTERGDRVCEQRLLTHLNGNRGYYNRAVWTLMDPSERRLYLEAALGANSEVLYAIDDKPIAVSGNQVAFPYNGPAPSTDGDEEPNPAPVESIVTLPTRGLFAEAELGHCNSCEKRDVTRMWDWRVMTTEEPPAITGIEPGPKGQIPDIAQGQLPSNVIQIAPPLVEPDPTGLADALKVLGTPNIFRDMSGLDEVSSLLGKLADGTNQTLASMTKGAAEAKGKVDQIRKDMAGGGGGGSASANGKSGGSGTKSRSDASESDAGAQIDRLKAIDEAKKSGLLTDKQANDATVGLLGGEVLPAFALDRNISQPLGIDVSHHNGTIDWDRVFEKNGNVFFAFIKASEGTAIDNRFQFNWVNARDAGLICGAYHIWHPEIAGKTQAQTFIDQLGFLTDKDLAPVLSVIDTPTSDFTGLSTTDLENNIQEYSDAIQNEFGKVPIIYTTPEFWKDPHRMNNSTKFSSYPVWLADWHPKDEPTLPGGWPTWEFWMMTDSGQVDGVNGLVDIDMFHGDLRSLFQMTGRDPSVIPV